MDWKVFRAHDHGLTPGEIAETPEVRLEPPEEPIVPSDHPVICGGDDKDEGTVMVHLRVDESFRSSQGQLSKASPVTR